MSESVFSDEIQRSLPGEAETKVVSLKRRSNTVSSLEVDRCDGRDSGYASVATSGTPESFRAGFTDGIVLPGSKLWPQKRRTLTEYDDSSISQLTWNRFKDLVELFQRPLSKHLSKSNQRFRRYSIKLKLLGEDKEDARPWIVVQCDGEISLWVRQFFNRKNIVSEYQPPKPDALMPFFDFIVSERPPRKIGADGTIHVYGHANSKAGIQHSSLCGSLVKVKQDGEKQRAATIGGLVKVTSKEGNVLICAMTAGHFVLQDYSDLESDWSEDGIEEDSDEEDDVDLSQTEQRAYELDIQRVVDRLEEAIQPIDHDIEHQIPLLDESCWSKIGKIETLSQISTNDGKDLDWALISFEDTFQLELNLQLGLGAVCSSELQEPPDQKWSGQHKRVLVSGGVSGLKSGVLSTNCSYLMLEQGGRMVETFSLKLDDGTELQPGDCGSWVTDQTNFAVYGHVVATDSFSEAYVVPIQDSLEHMKCQLSAQSVTLATMGDISRYQLGGLHQTSHSLPTQESINEVVEVEASNSASCILLSPLPRTDTLTGPQHRPRLSDLPDYISYKHPIPPSANFSQSEPSTAGIDSGYSTMRTTPCQAELLVSPSSPSSTSSSVKRVEGLAEPVATYTYLPYLTVEDALEWKRRYKIARMSKIEPLFSNEEVKKLNNREMVFIVDDSRSMGNHWHELTKVFEALAYIVKGFDPNGIDLYFTMSSQRHCSKASRPLTSLIESRQPDGTADLRTRLEAVLEDYSKRHSNSVPLAFRKGDRKPQPLNVYVLTDDIWELSAGIFDDIAPRRSTQGFDSSTNRELNMNAIMFGINPAGPLYRTNYRLPRRLGSYFYGANAADRSTIPISLTSSKGDFKQMILGGIRKFEQAEIDAQRLDAIPPKPSSMRSSFKGVSAGGSLSEETQIKPETNNLDNRTRM